MLKRSFFLSLAGGLLASLAFATPSQAGSTLVTTDVTFGITKPMGTTVTDFSVAYTPVDPIANLMITSSSGLSGLSITESAANTIEVAFTKSSMGSVSYTFTTGASADGVASLYLTPAFSGQSSTIKAASTSLSVTATVPEPSTVALLGIGMTGLLAFRRLFKRPSAA